MQKTQFRDDDALLRVATPQHPDSHIKIFIPNIPYTYIAKCTNSGLIRSYDNERGWEYELAKSHKRVGDFTYEFELREGLKFQDGSEFDTDDVVFNFEYFKRSPILYTNIDKVDFDVIKIDKYKFKIVLKQKYEMFLTDLARIFFYTREYLKKYGFKGSETGSGTKRAGAYGMGPYILKEGYALGSKQTSQIELEANPYYWNKDYPKIKRVTAYTQLNAKDALRMITQEEGELDFAPIDFNKKIEVLTSKYAKLNISKSTNNFIIFFNLINANERLKSKEVRVALNQAIDQENLLNFVYKNEGYISPFASSVNYEIVQKVLKNKMPKEEEGYSKEKMHKLLNGLELNVFTQDSFMFLFKGIEYQLKKYGVTLNYTVTSSEKDIYGQLLTTHKSQNTQKWDLLIWGDDDWYYANPWSVFFIYEDESAWSTIGKDRVMKSYIDEFFITKTDSKEYEKVVSKILYRAKEMAYTLRVPSPNKVVALNKEVIYKPYKGAVIPIWEMQITKDHYSIRGKREYPTYLEAPIKPKREKYE
ncbi:MAG: ABC transporter substrate-binding protein [Sulfurimonas sp.]|uniref:ABC transporter substrate-binding protein n=1 Tax=Sulfurimonas sp. TaxID=2022749 RepID=UPI0025D5FC78|nr:ABC transporter substrate-binding protein [Sulfurimonas sp.]MCK9491861.1 ABC transporter substrate-binding protein [Sulfurimonas sp.]